VRCYRVYDVAPAVIPIPQSRERNLALFFLPYGPYATLSPGRVRAERDSSPATAGSE
jgi:hypothetical protein